MGEELDLGPEPALLAMVLPAFREAARGRRYVEGHPLPLGPEQILAWFRLSGRRPDPYLAGLLMELDTRWLLAMAQPPG